MLNNLLIEILEGDITKQKVDAICNPANSLLLMGGGAAGAIKRAGGAEIEMEAMKYAPVPVGKAVATGAGKLNSKWVIHAPTMERPAMPTTAEKVYRATKAALLCADEVGARDLVIPGMGTGVGGVSTKDAAEAMMRAIAEFKSKAKSLKRIILCDIDKEMVEAWKRSKLGKV
ncbi:MAG: macro domain-containing protein [Candidatus Hadarchaeum sp.]|uniref:macro domain-containing protein n=1 Tax=Candidatus Hadarchaeum sp. TaxID=2883567 RepID=UPI003176F96E